MDMIKCCIPWITPGSSKQETENPKKAATPAPAALTAEMPEVTEIPKQGVEKVDATQKQPEAENKDSIPESPEPDVEIEEAVAVSVAMTESYAQKPADRSEGTAELPRHDAGRTKNESGNSEHGRHGREGNPEGQDTETKSEERGGEHRSSRH